MARFKVLMLRQVLAVACVLTALAGLDLSFGFSVVQAADTRNTVPRGARALPGERLRHGGTAPELVVVPPGSFRMGEAHAEGSSFERPVHRVQMPRAFAIGKFEVTFEEYDRFCRASGRPLPPDDGAGRGRRPVINVTWRDAVAYTEWLSSETGHAYRLPTEAEWEYAARGGAETEYFWGDRQEDACRYANVAGQEAVEAFPSIQGHPCRDPFPVTAEVGSFLPNRFGLHDMLGNVWEWCLDGWHSDYRNAPGQDTAWKSWSEIRVRRGGSWFSAPRNIRSAARNGTSQTYSGNDTGFRIARDL